MKSNTLDVFYDGEAAPGQPKAAQPAGQPDTGQIRRLEAKGNVVVTQKDQIATGDTVIFDTAANTVMLTGNVVVTQGQNVLKGASLTVNLATGVSYFEGKPGMPVSGLFLTNSARASKGGDSRPPEPKPGDARAEAKPADARPEARPGDATGSARSKDGPKAAKQAPGQPLQLR
jgi:lipopolysaccharide export system protein LptA